MTLISIHDTWIHESILYHAASLRRTVFLYGCTLVSLYSYEDSGHHICTFNTDEKVFMCLIV